MLNVQKLYYFFLFLLSLLILILIHFNIFFSKVKNSGIENYIKTKIDSVVVLTGDKFRIVKGLELLSQNPDSKLLLSGVNKDISVVEIENAFPKYKELFVCCIEIESISENTFENIRETFLWIRNNKYRNTTIVTSDYHLPRVKLESKRLINSENIYYVPTKNVSEERFSRIKKLVIEYIKYLRTYISLSIGLY
tara:strand:+ start:3164 stop:3745 length:582 start_codon:yes stop_codon:yes gene_type:complete